MNIVEKSCFLLGNKNMAFFREKLLNFGQVEPYYPQGSEESYESPVILENLSNQMCGWLV